MSLAEIEGRGGRRHWLRYLIFIVVVALFFTRAIASSIIEFEWWREMNQLATWVNMLIYGVAPLTIATVVAFIVFWIAHARGVRASGTRLRRYPLYAKISTVVLLALAVFVALATMDTWVAVRYFGGRGLAGGAAEWRDPAFGLPLAFHLFELPFYSMALRTAETVAFIAAILYWLTARLWEMRDTLPNLRHGGMIDLGDLHLADALKSRFLRATVALFLVFLAIRFYLDRFALLRNDHGFLVGIDYVDEHIVLPLLWLEIGACLIAAASILAGQFRWLLVLAAALLVRAVVPPIVSAAYVKPSEVSLERPYIERHIAATRSAFGFDHRTKEIPFDVKPEAKLDLAAYKPLLDNVRLWDWRAFHAAVTQLQPLRPYVYSEIDVDRYTLDGQLRQVLLTPREIDIAALGEAGTRWINPSFIYTHGYGLVMAEAKSIAPDGSPVLFIKDAPPVVTASGLKLTRPELYYGETVHEPVFVRTAQPEFNYPSANETVNTRYSGTGGFPISSVGLRLAAALSEGEWNILLTSYLTPESRMMIRRKVTDRLNALAGFLLWDSDPYLVVTDAGNLVWMVDGYMATDRHPYSRSFAIEGAGDVNYIRNSVKATVDAYNGTVHLYVFDDEDPMLRAYRNLFPHLFEPSASMPADLRKHARYPETMFRAQAEMYRMYHVRDAETFYNRSDAWDIAKDYTSEGGDPQPVRPNYVVASLPGQQNVEFLLMIPFTPRDRENLIGLMMARCDGEHLGEVQFLELPRQQILYGPRQVEARINQDQNISKDLTLWNQQGSQVLHGQMLVLPIGNTFLYVEPFYIQASQARMPQLKKVVLAMGNTLIYQDTYDEALAQLAQQMGETPLDATAPQTAAGAPKQNAAAPQADPRIAEIRQHLDRYQQLVSEGKWSDAGKELEAVQRLVGH